MRTSDCYSRLPGVMVKCNAGARADVRQLNDGRSFEDLQSWRTGHRLLCGYASYCEGLFLVFAAPSARCV